jgi:hypothetical protein
MQLLLPLIFYGLTAIILGALRQRGMRMAYLWLIPTILSLVSWVVFLVMPIPASAPLLKIPGLFSLSADKGLAFIMDSSIWGFIYLVVCLVLVYFLTMVIRLEKEKRTWLWIGWLVLCMAAMLSFSAGNISTLIVTWVLFDLLDFLFTYFILKIDDVDESLFGFFSSRVVSVLLLIAAAIFLPVETPQWLPTPLAPTAYFLLFLSGLFRTGLLPSRSIYKPAKENGSSFHFLKRILPLMSGFSLLSFLPINYLNSISQLLISIIFFLLAIVFIISAIQQKLTDQLWFDSIICLGCITVISGTPIGLLGWSGVALVGAAIHHFFSHRSGHLRIFALLGIFSLSGVPYSIGALAQAGLTSSFSFTWLIFVIPLYALLIYLFIETIQLPFIDSPTSEPLYLAVYLIGLFLMAFTPFAILIKNIELAGSVLGFWWSGIAVIVFCLVIFLIQMKVYFKKYISEKFGKSMRIINRVISFQWLGQIWKWLSWFISGIIQFLTQILAGDGGVIWAIVMLVLLVSLISVGRS